MLIQNIEGTFKLLGSQFQLCQGFLSVPKASQLKPRSSKGHRHILFKSNTFAQDLGPAAPHLSRVEGLSYFSLRELWQKKYDNWSKSDSSHRVLKDIRRC